MSDANTRPVGTDAVFKKLLADAKADEVAEAMTELNANVAVARRLVFHGTSPCCYVSLTTSHRACPRRAVPGKPWCKQHARVCRKRLATYQDACGRDESAERKAEMYAGAKEVVSALFGSLDRAKREIEELQDSVPVRGGDKLPMSLSDFESLSVPLRARYDALSTKDRAMVRARVGDMYDGWRRCWFGRFVYRKSCEACHQDEGHVMAYYLFKAATLVGKVIRESDEMQAT